MSIIPDFRFRRKFGALIGTKPAVWGRIRIMETSKITLSDTARDEWSMLNVEIDFSAPVSSDDRTKIGTVVNSWLKMGIEEGFGEGYLHYGGELLWDTNGMWALVPVDMGTDDGSAVSHLEAALGAFSTITAIRVGFDHPDISQDAEKMAVLDDLNAARGN
jgi:hypothetical protein